MKPRLLDLFCGAIAYYIKSCYNKVCLLNVLIAVKKLRLSASLNNSALIGVCRERIMDLPVKGVVGFVVRYFQSLLEVTRTVNIVLRRVRKRQIRRIHSNGIRLILKLCLNTIKTGWLKILVLGEKSTVTKGWKLYEYWGANV